MQILQALIGRIEPGLRQRIRRFIGQIFRGVDQIQQTVGQQPLSVVIRVAFGIAVIFPFEIAAFQRRIQPLPQPDAGQLIMLCKRQHKAFAGVIVHAADQQQADDRRLRLTEQLAEQTFKCDDARPERCLIDREFQHDKIGFMCDNLCICEQIAFHGAHARFRAEIGFNFIAAFTESFREQHRIGCRTESGCGVALCHRAADQPDAELRFCQQALPADAAAAGFQRICGDLPAQCIRYHIVTAPL